MTPRTLTKSSQAKRCGRPAKAKEKTLADVLTDPSEKLAADDARAAAARKDAVIYAEMHRIKAANEVREAERIKRETAAMAPIVRAAEAIARLPRACGVFATRGNRVRITVPGGKLVELSYSDDDKERPIKLYSDYYVYQVMAPMDVSTALDWLMRTAIDFGVGLPE